MVGGKRVADSSLVTPQSSKRAKPCAATARDQVLWLSADPPSRPIAKCIQFAHPHVLKLFGEVKVSFCGFFDWLCRTPNNFVSSQKSFGCPTLPINAASLKRIGTNCLEPSAKTNLFSPKIPNSARFGTKYMIQSCPSLSQSLTSIFKAGSSLQLELLIPMN